MNDLAQATGTGIEINKVFGPAMGAGGFTDVGKLVSVLLPNLLVIAGILAFIAVIFTGIQVISSAGDAKAEEANKNAFTAAIIGLIIIFGAYFFIQVAEAILGRSLLTP